MLEVNLRKQQEIIQKWNLETSIVVSICCITYNHEEYIEDALKGFLMQETDFPFEILIHDDASQDNTAKIINSYQKKYPKIIKPILQTVNHFSRGYSVNLDFNFLRAKGKYIALCEGDDYWIDSEKLSKQITFLEENSDFIATYHNVEVIDGNDNVFEGKNNLYEKFSEYNYTIKDAEKLKLPSQTATLVYRNIWADAESRLIDAYRNCETNGDQKLAVLFALKGNVFCMSDTMAIHRKILNKGDSWSAANFKKNTTLYAYNSLLEINKFSYNLFEITLSNKTERLNVVFSALLHIIKKPTQNNILIMKKIIEINQDSVSEVIFYTLKKLLHWPLRKVKLYLEK